MRLFELQRDVDVSGASGTGRVAQGVVFDDGRVAFRWLTPTRSTVTFDSVEDMEKIHGHGGSTRVVFLDALKPKRWVCENFAGGWCVYEGPEGDDKSKLVGQFKELADAVACVQEGER
jgi:hypothetical protein